MVVLPMLFLMIASGCGSHAHDMQIPEHPDVRNATWDMTMAEVIFCEGREPDETLDNALIFNNVRMEKIPEVDIVYNFYNIDLVNTDGTEKLLSSVVYNFNGVKKMNHRQLHNSYISIADEYTKKYGEPIRDDRETELTDNATMEKTTLRQPVEQIYDTSFDFGGSALYIAEWVNEEETTNIKLRFDYGETGPSMNVIYEYIEPNNDI